MDTIKAKNFIIIVLLVMNLLLLIAVFWDIARSDDAENTALSGALEVLNQNGISVAEGVDFSYGEVSAFTTARNEGLEQQHVVALIGESTSSDQGGSIIRYTSLDGYSEATFRGVGGIQVQILNYNAGEDFDAESEARRMASALGVEVLQGSGSAQVNVTDGKGTVVLFCAHEGVLIINCRLVFTFSEDSVIIEGTRPLDTVTSETPTDVLDAPTIIMRFLTLLRERGQVCSEISGAELAYNFTATAAGDGTLWPVWRIITDTGEFCLDAVTGVDVDISS